MHFLVVPCAGPVQALDTAEACGCTEYYWYFVVAKVTEILPINKGAEQKSTLFQT
jgi:hypothetical protein